MSNLFYINLNLVVLKQVKAMNVNPCLATPGYRRFQADFKPNNMSLKWIIRLVVDAQ